MQIAKNSSIKSKVVWLLNNFEKETSNILIIIIVALLFTQTIARYFGHTFAWIVELCRHLFLFAIYFAASAAIQNRAHFKVTLHINKLPKKIQLSLLALTDLIWFIFNCVVVFLFLKLILYMGGRSFISAALHWDMRYVYIVMPFAFILMNIRLIQNWYYHFKHREQGEES